ncbi:hypothetical protein CY0110_09276 [Crocosphaera chwakensis CCY0110]|uniref:Uncharacterized protein n=1 Tax=Crocosphaera chwakensis CCY0110 TaxID=391612 RepID=A3IVH8_9CHRO|nr:hypothetical protein CY0110_09276 [Crocosphaera chwakensis CCY0110]
MESTKQKKINNRIFKAVLFFKVIFSLVSTLLETN